MYSVSANQSGRPLVEGSTASQKRQTERVKETGSWRSASLRIWDALDGLSCLLKLDCPHEDAKQFLDLKAKTHDIVGLIDVVEDYLSKRVDGAIEKPLIEKKSIELNITGEQHALLKKLERSDTSGNNYFICCVANVSNYVVELQKANGSSDETSSASSDETSSASSDETSSASSTSSDESSQSDQKSIDQKSELQAVSESSDESSQSGQESIDQESELSKRKRTGTESLKGEPACKK